MILQLIALGKWISSWSSAAAVTGLFIVGYETVFERQNLSIIFNNYILISFTYNSIGVILTLGNATIFSIYIIYVLNMCLTNTFINTFIYNFKYLS